jgi:signal peptidase I
VLAFAVRFAVAESFYVSGDGVAPLIPRGSRVLVYKLASSFKPGDIVVYRNAEGVNLVGEIDRENNSGRWRIERNAGCARQVQEVPRDRIVGRVFLNTR